MSNNSKISNITEEEFNEMFEIDGIQDIVSDLDSIKPIIPDVVDVVDVVDDELRVSYVSEIKVTEIEAHEEEEIEVVKLELNGKTYLRSKDNILYDIDSHDGIGKWNEKDNKIYELVEEE